MTGTALERRSTLDLTRAPQEQWNAEMVKVVAKNIFRGMEITEPQLYYCLSVAESLGLNPMVGEIYFIPGKSRDGKGPAWQPYIGRTGLVKKATERGCYYESDTVHANDKFRIVRKADGTQTCTHSYGHGDRGEIVGAYAFLHDETGRRKPAFFYAKLSEYLPSFDAEWKMDASPWGNQRSAMIEKCFDADTEVLTDRGFEPFAIAEGRVLQVTEQGLEPTDARPFWQSYDGPMITHSSREVDFAVTPNHDLLLTSGRVEAGDAYCRARSRPVDGLAVVRCFVPLCADAPDVSDASLTLAGYYMADGHADNRGSVVFNLSRPRKLRALRNLGFPLTERLGRRAGTRVGGMTATMDATWLRCSAEYLPQFILEGKRIDVARLLTLSARQARIFVDAWREFDGDARNRLYCTDLQRLGAFEIASVHAGYSLSRRRSRLNLALSDRPNYYVTLSERRASALRRWGAGSDRPGLRLRPADGRGVWCVTVPSGVIVVRRRGFSMLCGNCAMIGAGRKRLDLGNVLADGEVPRYQQMGEVGPGSASAGVAAEGEWPVLTEDPLLQERVRLAAVAAGWPAAKAEMVLAGKSDDELRAAADELEGEQVAYRDQHGESMQFEKIRATDLSGDEAERVAEAVREREAGAEEAVIDAVVVPDAEHVEALRRRLASLEDDLNDPELSDDQRGDLVAEYEQVQGELTAAENPDQLSLG